MSLEDAADRFLEEGLARLPELNDAEQQDGHTERFLAAVEALAAVRAISLEEAASWTERFERALKSIHAPANVLATPPTRFRADEILERLSSRRTSATGTEEWFWVLTALQNIGVLSGQRRREEEARIVARGRGAKTHGTEMSAAEAAPPLRATDLQRVIPGPSRRRLGLRVTSLEVYSDCVIVRWHYLVQEADANRALSSVADDMVRRLELRDDSGTQYMSSRLGSVVSSLGGLAAAPRRAVTGSQAFVPTVANDATVVTIKYSLARFPISL
jgi:hypothetical protein